MRYTFISAHSVRGISAPRSEADVILYQDPSKRARVLLVSDARAHLHVLNRHLALMSMMLRALVGQPLSLTFPELLASETAKVWEDRKKKIGNDPVLVLEIHGDIEASIPANAREVLDFILCFDAFDKKAVKASHAQFVSAVMTAVRIEIAEPVEFQAICDGSYLLTDDGRTVHSATVEAGSVRAYISKQLSDEVKLKVSKAIAQTIAAPELERVMRLHTYSLRTDSDNYRAFLASWSAMEILIAKLFPTYHAKLVSDLRNSHHSPGLQIYLSRITTVMNDKHSLADKFAVLTVYLDDSNSEDEVARFVALKRIRDRLFHGEEIVDVDLPTRDVQRLFDKYIRGHLRYAA